MRRCWPAESWWQGVLANGSRLTWLKAFSIVAFERGFVLGICSDAHQERFSKGLNSALTPARWPIYKVSVASADRDWRISLPRHSTVPRYCWLKPANTRSNVVLPLPLGPSILMPLPGERLSDRFSTSNRSPRSQLTESSTKTGSTSCWGAWLEWLDATVDKKTLA